MSTYKELRKDFNKKVKELQDKCSHEKTVWCIEEWAPAHLTGFEVLVCETCNKRLDRRGNPVYDL